MYRTLFSPAHIGRVEIKNRVAMTAMGVELATAGGGVNDDIIAFYEARAKGGAGLIITEECRVLDGAGAGEPFQIAARGVGDLQGLERLMDAVHKYGAKIFVQLHHPGRNYGGDAEAVAASAIRLPGAAKAPRALTISEIAAIQQAFVTGAKFVQAAGADGVELHGAHGYLINGFLSPYLNRRNDRYGGSFDNRMRFLIEIIAGIRQQCGSAFPLGVRLSVEEFLGDQGNDLAASGRIAAALETAGVDFLDISSTIPDSPDATGLSCIEPGTFEQGWKAYMAAEIRKHVKIPLIAVANIKEPHVAEEILAGGACDFVGVARAHLADPEWCNKALAGKADTIRECIGCLVCFDRIAAGHRVKCSVNPTTGREREFAHLERDGEGRKVAVVGGGPAGFTAAMVLQARGFHPILFESGPRLGGTLNVADKGAGRDKITRLVDSMIAQAREAGIELRLGEEATVAKVEALSPCGVFVACGARPLIPAGVSGVDLAHVATAEDILLGHRAAEGDCLIIGSGMTGLETAEVVARAGRRVTIADMLPHIGGGAPAPVIADLINRLAPYAPTYRPGHRLLRITRDGAELEPLEGGRLFVKADTVILALGVEPRKAVVDAFRSAFPAARVIGDAALGGRILDATQAAYGQAFVFSP